VVDFCAVFEIRMQQRSSRRYVSLSTLLAISFGGLMLLAVGSVLIVSLGGAGRNTGELLADKAELILSSIEQRVRQHLGPVMAQAEYLKNSIESGQLDVEDPKALETALRSALAATPQVTGIGFIRSNLEVARVERRDGTLITEDWSRRPEIIRVFEDFRAGKGAGWSEPVWSSPFQQTIIPYLMPVHRGGNLIGILVPAIVVTELSRYVAEISSPAQWAFILHGRDEVLAHPALAERPLTGTRERPLPLLSEVDDRVLQQIWSAERRLMNLPLRSTDQGHIVPFRDDYFIYMYREVPRLGEKPWIIGAAMPGSDAGQEAERLRMMVLIGSGLLLVSVLSAIVVGRRVARPIRDIVRVTEAVQTLEFDKAPVLPHSRIRELDRAGQALNAMVAALRWFELYLPKRLVHRLIAQGQDDLARAYERDVTVMFTDLSGFTRMASRLSPSETASFLNTHFALIGACVEAEGGTIDKYIGDSLMAFWGAPEEQPDHVERACRAARAIASEVQADNRARLTDGLAPVRVRIGISTGSVLVGNIGAPTRMNYTLVGDVVNIAQRLEQAGKDVHDDSEAITLVTEGVYTCMPQPERAVFWARREVRNREGTMAIYRLT
jgi:adenylate cyclase